MADSQKLSIEQLNSKSTHDLREILRRQEAILYKRKFLHSLPDHGQKVKDFARILQQLISQRDEQQLQETTELMNDIQITDDYNTSINKSTLNVSSSKFVPQNNFAIKTNSMFDIEGDTTLKDLINRQQKDIVYLYEEATADKIVSGSKTESNDHQKSQNVRLSDGVSVSSDQTVISYQKVMEKSQDVRPQFRPNRDLKVTSIGNLSADYFPHHSSVPITASGDHSDTPIPCDDLSHKESQENDMMQNHLTNTQSDTTNSENGRTQTTDNEALPISHTSIINTLKNSIPSTIKHSTPSIKHSSPLFEEPKYVYGEAKTLTLQESFLLQQTSQHQLERIQASHAAARLSERLSKDIVGGTMIQRSNINQPVSLGAEEHISQSQSYRAAPKDLDSDDDVSDHNEDCDD